MNQVGPPFGKNYHKAAPSQQVDPTHPRDPHAKRKPQHKMGP